MPKLHLPNHSAVCAHRPCGQQLRCRNYVVMSQWPETDEKASIWIRILLKFVARGPIDKNSTLVQVMAMKLTGNKPLPETMLARDSGFSIVQKMCTKDVQIGQMVIEGKRWGLFYSLYSWI